VTCGVGERYDKFVAQLNFECHPRLFPALNHLHKVSDVTHASDFTGRHADSEFFFDHHDHVDV
ncbi:hypothetical protein WDZ92_51205, partial [Nostoc sp. NIES-2111]